MLASVNGKPANRTLDLLREAIVTDIKILRNILPIDENELYTPKDNGVKCAKMALECFVEETKVLEKENVHNYSITDTIHRIQRNADVGWRRLAGDTAQPSECLQCESNEVQTTGVFLERMIEFVQFAFRDNTFE
ncbi:hypothetical protein lerEdw1_012271 [Lerista edwardsae]|nr:hypothetical protein lerEdw1_012271 [Lerista edwardsae]